MLDLTLLPLYRLDDQELTLMPGLLAVHPPRKPAHGRENDRLLVYLVLTGNATLSTVEYLQLTSQTANRFFETPGSLTSAMRAATEALNLALLERNLGFSGQGKYAVGWLVLVALRGENCTLLQSGPSHVFVLGKGGARHIHDPALSGKGLGVSQAATFHLSQTELAPGERMLLAGRPPAEWGQALSDSQHLGSLEAARRALFTLARGDLNAVLIQAHDGTGNLNILRPAPVEALGHKSVPPTVATSPPSGTEGLTPSSEQDSDRVIQTLEPSSEQNAQPPLESRATIAQATEPKSPPSAYAIPPQPQANDLPKSELDTTSSPASTPLAAMPEPGAPPLREMDEPIMDEPEKQREPSETTRQAARKVISGMQTWRRMSEAFTHRLQGFLPNLLPSEESHAPSSSLTMIFIAIAVPLLVVTIASVVYFRFGRSYQYDNYFLQAENAQAQALSATEPSRQRDGWQAVLFYLDKAETYRETPESQTMRQEAQSKLDALLGIQRLDFYPAFSSGVNAQISRMAASESDLYLLDAERGRVLHAAETGRSFKMDDAFRCDPGNYGGYQVGPIVDVLILPRLNSLDATVLGVDANGNLLYCAPGQVPQAIPLPLPDTNWGRVTGFALDSGNLYVLDAPSRAIWVYADQDASFVDRPYFFFGGQIPQLEDTIDLAVSGDDLYLLHADGHISTCSYSRLETVPTRCQDPALLVNNLPAFQDIDLYAQTHITQMQLIMLPDSMLLLLDADNRSLLRLSPRTLELQNQIYPRPGSSIKSGSAGAMVVNPNRVLFLAVDDQVYFANDMP